ncbi:MAG: S41 family peptidase [Candidatus Brocadiae bacterium]|nr:S41 family peptidase [Candidatus Brocadiia bacterium]
MRGKDYIWLLLLGVLVVLQATPATARRDAEYDRFKQLVTIIEQVKRNYASEVSEDTLFLGAYKGVVAELDPYSQYMTPDDVQQLMVDTEGEFGGLGIEITLDENRILKVITPLEDTPAMKAGVLPGDRIIEIDGKSTYRMTILDAVKVLRGKPGTSVVITVVSESRKARQRITVTRDIIKVKSVRAAKMVDEKAKVGYVRMSNFQKDTAEELDRAVKGLLDDGMRALVLDLRRNPGGLLDSAVKVSDRFLDEGTIVSTKGRADASKRVFSATKAATYPHFPLAVLVSNYSASASEIVAGAVQDTGRGILVGDRTFGKGSVQSILPLDGGARLRLTTAKYYTPSGRCIHRGVDAKPEDPWGIQPDIVVETDVEDQIGLLKHWQQERIVVNNKNNGEHKDTPPSAPAKKGAEDEEAKPFVDRPLERAVDALKAILVYRKG